MPIAAQYRHGFLAPARNTSPVEPTTPEDFVAVTGRVRAWNSDTVGVVRLNHRVAVITGGGHGIGRGIAMAFASEGVRVVLNDLPREPSIGHAEDVARLISSAGGEVHVSLGDAANTADMERVIGDAVERFGRLDILVNNANPGRRMFDGPRDVLHVTEEQLYQGYFLPFKAAYVNTQLAARQMIQQGMAGAVVTITSVHQERPWGSDSIYGSMKAALRRLVMSQARELAPHRIRVNAIAPGFIDNRLFVGERGERYDQFNIRAESEIPLGQGKPEDIARAAVYLVSDEARYVTGTCLLVDGGMLLPPVTEI
jgi:NAD(P)-dependent dehydrogenase (short-subunit alcohol dehydrogenase family)